MLCPADPCGSVLMDYAVVISAIVLGLSVLATIAKFLDWFVHSDPKTMVQKVAPFLTVDGDPFPFVDQKTGHIMWMVDAYTTTANYPYSERQSLSNLTGTLNLTLSPSTPAGGTGNGCARRTVASAS